MSQENVELVRRAYEAFTRRDRHHLLAMTAPGFTADISRSTGPEAGIYRGTEGLGRLIDAYWDGLEEFSITPVELLPSGNEVIAVTRGRGRGRISGAEAQATAAQVWRIEQGKLTAFTAYQSKREALEAVGLPE